MILANLADDGVSGGPLAGGGASSPRKATRWRCKRRSGRSRPGPSPLERSCVLPRASSPRRAPMQTRPLPWPASAGWALPASTLSGRSACSSSPSIDRRRPPACSLRSESGCSRPESASRGRSASSPTRSRRSSRSDGWTRPRSVSGGSRSEAERSIALRRSPPRCAAAACSQQQRNDGEGALGAFEQALTQHDARAHAVRPRPHAPGPRWGAAACQAQAGRASDPGRGGAGLRGARRGTLGAEGPSRARPDRRRAVRPATS